MRVDANVIDGASTRRPAAAAPLMEINASAPTCALFIYSIGQQREPADVKETVLDRAGRYRRLGAYSDQRSRRNSFGA